MNRTCANCHFRWWYTPDNKEPVPICSNNDSEHYDDFATDEVTCDQWKTTKTATGNFGLVLLDALQHKAIKRIK